jgi:hypothetical protein
MEASVVEVLGRSSGEQQKDNLCGPFWAARVLNESGYSVRDGKAIDEDLLALRAGTVLPEAHAGSDVPPGAAGQTRYRYELPKAPVEQSGTSAQRLAQAVEAASSGQLCCVPLRGAWDAVRVERLVGEGRDAGARLIANVRTGKLWGSRPSIELLLAELDGQPAQGPRADWDVGHFEGVAGGRARFLSVAWMGRPPPAAAASAG